MMTPEEKATHIRHLFDTEGWRMQAEALDRRLELVRSQAFLLPDERPKEFRKWDINRIGGNVLGLEYARKFLSLWLQQYEAAERAAQQAEKAEEALGHPYGPDAMAEDWANDGGLTNP